MKKKLKMKVIGEKIAAWFSMWTLFIAILNSVQHVIMGEKKYFAWEDFIVAHSTYIIIHALHVILLIKKNVLNLLSWGLGQFRSPKKDVSLVDVEGSIDECWRWGNKQLIFKFTFMTSFEVAGSKLQNKNVFFYSILANNFVVALVIMWFFWPTSFFSSSHTQFQSHSLIACNADANC